jgi:hypothetical protein
MSKKKFKAKDIAWAKHVAARSHDPQHPPPGAVLADYDELKHINTYGQLPRYYIDKPFVCRDCGTEEIWTAEQQKWWYEVAKGHIDSTAVRCHECRQKRKQKNQKQI